MTANTTERSALHQQVACQAAQEIFQATCNLTLEPAGPDQQAEDGEVIIGIISLVGDAEMSVFMGLPRATATAVTARFAGFDIPFESSDMGDAVGELTNMLAGQVKNILDRSGVRADISLPTVIRAQSIHIMVQRNATTMKVCYSTKMGPLWLGLTEGKNSGFVA